MININKFKITERPECSADTKLFFDDVYTNNTHTKKAQVETVQSGRSMIEMLGVLAIVGVLSVGGIAGYSKAMEKFKINKTIDQITHIATNIRTLYSQQTSYNGLFTDTAILMGAIPSDMASSSQYAVTNPFGGDTWVSGSIWEDVSSFSIIYEGFSKNACITLATMDWGSSHSSGLIGVAVGSSALYSPAWKTDRFYAPQLRKSCNSEYSTYGGGVEFCAKKLPLNVARAAQLCNCPDNTCNFILTYE